MNELAIKGVNIIPIPKGKSVRHHASSADLMMLIKKFLIINFTIQNTMLL